jgi:hypothetical protein
MWEHIVRFDTPLQQLGDAPRGPDGAVSLDLLIADLASDLLRDRLRDQLRWRIVEVHAAAGSVAFQAMAYVEVLLEVVAQREVEEGPLICGQKAPG